MHFELSLKMIPIFSLILLFKSSDNNENDMIIDDIVKPRDMSVVYDNYEPLKHKLQEKQEEYEIKKYIDTSKEDHYDIKFLLNSLYNDIILKDNSDWKTYYPDDESEILEKNSTVDYNAFAQFRRNYDQEKKEEFKELFTPFNDLYKKYRSEKFNFNGVLDNMTAILKYSIELAKENKPLNTSQKEFEKMLQWIRIFNESYCKSFKKLKDYVNNLPEKKRLVLDYCLKFKWDESLTDSLREFYKVKNEWNTIIEAKKSGN